MRRAVDCFPLFVRSVIRVVATGGLISVRDSGRRLVGGGGTFWDQFSFAGCHPRGKKTSACQVHDHRGRQSEGGNVNGHGGRIRHAGGALAGGIDRRAKRGHRLWAMTQQGQAGLRQLRDGR
jgi:hypothetical protein